MSLNAESVNLPRKTSPHSLGMKVFINCDPAQVNVDRGKARAAKFSECFLDRPRAKCSVCLSTARALKDDGLGMTPEKLQELEQSNLQPTEGEGCQAEERCATQAPVEQMPGFRFNRALLNEDPRAMETQLKTSSKLGNMKDKRQTQAPVSRLVRRYENTSSIDPG